MLSGNTSGNINISTALLMSNNMNYMPMVLGQGIFGQIQTLPYEWAVSNIAVVNYTMKSNTDILGADAVTDANVVPNVRATFGMKSVIVGRVEANILYHKRPNTNIEANLGTMHFGMVLDGYNEWAREMAKKIDYSLINGYKDSKYVNLGLNGMRNFATEINATPLDPKDYGACYSFFATQIDILISTLGIGISSISILIGSDAVQAMQMTPIAGTTESVWNLLKSNILQSVEVNIAPRGVHDNQCSFTVEGFIAPVSIADTDLFTFGEEQRARGNHQYEVYMEAVLPSIMVTNNDAVRHQNEMIDSTKMASSLISIKGASKKGSEALDAKKVADIKTLDTKKVAEVKTSAETKVNAEL